MHAKQDTNTLLFTIKYFLNPNDGRYEDFAKGNVTKKTSLWMGQHPTERKHCVITSNTHEQDH